jgi:hypothetical protein
MKGTLMYQIDEHARHVELELAASLERRRLERLVRAEPDTDRSLRLALGRALVRLGHRVGGEHLGAPVPTG